MKPFDQSSSVLRHAFVVQCDRIGPLDWHCYSHGQRTMTHRFSVCLSCLGQGDELFDCHRLSRLSDCKWLIDSSPLRKEVRLLPMVALRLGETEYNSEQLFCWAQTCKSGWSILHQKRPVVRTSHWVTYIAHHQFRLPDKSILCLIHCQINCTAWLLTCCRPGCSVHPAVYVHGLSCVWWDGVTRQAFQTNLERLAYASLFCKHGQQGLTWLFTYARHLQYESFDLHLRRKKMPRPRLCFALLARYDRWIAAGKY